MNKDDIVNIGLKKHRSLTEFLIKGEGSLRLWEGVASGLVLVNSFFILTTLGLYEFGLYQLILSFIAIVGSFNIKFFDGAIAIEMRHYFNRRENGKAKKVLIEYALIKTIVAFVLAAVVFFGSSIVAGRYGADIGLFIKIISLLLVVEVLLELQKLFLKSLFSFAYFGASAAREFIKLFLLGSLFFFGHLGIAEILGIHVLGWFGSAIIIFFLFSLRLYKKVFSAVSPAKKFLLGKIIKAHGFWLAIRFGFSRVTKNITPWLIKFFVSTEAVAIYSVAIKLIAFILELFPINMLPWIFLIKIDNKKEMSHIFNRSLKYVTWLGIILLVLGFIFVPIIINLILPKYNISMTLFRFMLIVLPIYGFYKLLKGVLNVLREYKILALRVFTEAVVIMGILVIFLPLVGVFGAAISYIATYLARVIFFYPALIRSHPYFKVRLQDIFVFDEYDKNFIKSFSRQILVIIRGFLTKIKMK